MRYVIYCLIGVGLFFHVLTQHPGMLPPKELPVTFVIAVAVWPAIATYHALDILEGNAHGTAD